MHFVVRFVREWTHWNPKFNCFSFFFLFFFVVAEATGVTGRRTWGGKFAFSSSSRGNRRTSVAGFWPTLDPALRRWWSVMLGVLVGVGFTPKLVLRRRGWNGVLWEEAAAVVDEALLFWNSGPPRCCKASTSFEDTAVVVGGGIREAAKETFQGQPFWLFQTPMRSLRNILLHMASFHYCKFALLKVNFVSFVSASNDFAQVRTEPLREKRRPPYRMPSSSRYSRTSSLYADWSDVSLWTATQKENNISIVILPTPTPKGPTNDAQRDPTTATTNNPLSLLLPLSLVQRALPKK